MPGYHRKRASAVHASVGTPPASSFFGPLLSIKQKVSRSTGGSTSQGCQKSIGLAVGLVCSESNPWFNERPDREPKKAALSIQALPLNRARSTLFRPRARLKKAFTRKVSTGLQNILARHRRPKVTFNDIARWRQPERTGNAGIDYQHWSVDALEMLARSVPVPAWETESIGQFS